MPLPGEENWAPDADADAWEDEQCQNEEVRPSADREAVDSWLQQHAASEFVAVPNKKVTKKPKFQGEKPGWLFKLGAQGLGYYRDRGGLVMVVSIAQAIQPATSLPAAPLALDEL